MKKEISDWWTQFFIEIDFAFYNFTIVFYNSILQEESSKSSVSCSRYDISFCQNENLKTINGRNWKTVSAD